MFNFDNSYSRLPEKFYARVNPATVPDPELIKWNARLAAELGAHDRSFSDARLAEIFSGRKLLPGSEPIALAYAGHQFGQFVPRLGDGRALLLGEILDPAGVRRDIQLKGSGRTPFSRGGDGKAPLGPVLREYLVSEGLHHLGLPTTRSLAAVKTGELVYREKAFPGAILARVASSHIRVGTFEYFAAQNDQENLKILTKYSIKRHCPEILQNSEPYIQFFRRIGTAQVNLVTGWMALGFIHGVMNTDNMSITGETIDFGPCAFMDQFRLNQVFSSIDQFGRYSYSNQARITLWNLSRMGDCLALLMGQGAEQIRLLNEELDDFGHVFESLLASKMKKKLGILDKEQNGDKDIVQQWLRYLEHQKLDFTLSFRNLAGLLEKEETDTYFEKNQLFQDFFKPWKKRIQEQDADPQDIEREMNQINPVFIPRNHRIEQVIASALEDDFSLFHEMVEVLNNPYEDQERFSEYKSAPTPEQKVQATFCGT